MQRARSMAVFTLVAVLSAANATDPAGTSHARPANSRQVPRRQSRFGSGWLGVGVNTAILIVKVAIPSLGRQPLSWT